MKQDLNMQGNDFNVGALSSRSHDRIHLVPGSQYHVYLWLYHRNDTKYFPFIPFLVLLLYLPVV